VNKTFRLFVSSTFKDWKVERDWLKEDVFPKLKDYCRKEQATFLEIDLRWGVSEGATESHRVKDICLGEIQRCQSITSKPNFLILLSDRYGWRPVPTSLQESVWKKLIKRGVIPSQLDGLTLKNNLFYQSYQLDENAVPKEYVLSVGAPEEEIRNALDESYYNNQKMWEEVFENNELVHLLGSLTEQEIYYGALTVDSPEDHVRMVKRNNTNEKLKESGSKESDIAQVRLDKLYTDIESAIGVENIGALNSGDEGYEEKFKSFVYESLQSIIDEELMSEQTEEEKKVEPVAGVFDNDEQVKQLINPTTRTVLLYGPTGSGKSTLFLEASRRDVEGYTSLAYWPGLEPKCSSGMGLFNSILIDLIALNADREDNAKFNEDVGLGGLTKKINKELLGKKVFIYIDALDQFPSEDFVKSFDWSTLNAHVRVSTLSESIKDDFTKKSIGSVIDIAQMKSETASHILSKWLEEKQRLLTKEQRESVLAAFSLSGSPLHLRLLFNLAMEWKSSDVTGILPKGINEGIVSLFNAWVAEHGVELVSRVVAYLSIRDFGLIEGELLSLICDDEVILQELATRSPNSPKVDTLPEIIWSRLYFDMAPYLSSRIVDGELLLGFYHAQFFRVAREIDGGWVRQEIFEQSSSKYASLFINEWGAHKKQKTKPRERVFREMPYILKFLPNRETVYDICTDEEFIKGQEEISLFLPLEMLSNGICCFHLDSDDASFEMMMNLMFDKVQLNEDLTKRARLSLDGNENIDKLFAAIKQQRPQHQFKYALIKYFEDLLKGSDRAGLEELVGESKKISQTELSNDYADTQFVNDVFEYIKNKGKVDLKKYIRRAPHNESMILALDAIETSSKVVADEAILMLGGIEDKVDKVEYSKELTYIFLQNPVTEEHAYKSFKIYVEHKSKLEESNCAINKTLLLPREIRTILVALASTGQYESALNIIDVLPDELRDDKFLKASVIFYGLRYVERYGEGKMEPLLEKLARLDLFSSGYDASVSRTEGEYLWCVLQ